MKMPWIRQGRHERWGMEVVPKLLVNSIFNNGSFQNILTMEAERKSRNFILQSLSSKRMCLHLTKKRGGKGYKRFSQSTFLISWIKVNTEISGQRKASVMPPERAWHVMALARRLEGDIFLEGSNLGFPKLLVLRQREGGQFQKQRHGSRKPAGPNCPLRWQGNGGAVANQPTGNEPRPTLTFTQLNWKDVGIPCLAQLFAARGVSFL